MAAAYASLMSLMSVLTRIQHPSCPATFQGDESQIRSLCDQTKWFINFLEEYSDETDQGVERFEIEIVKSACGSEDLIESYVAEEILEGKRSDDEYVDFCNSLQRMMNEMEDIKTKVMDIKEQKSPVPAPSLVPISPISLVPSNPMGENIVVGIKEEVGRLVRRLTTGELHLGIIPIVGMGGIGKTTLARCVFNESKTRFKNVLAWATISQNFSVNQVIISLLRQFGVIDDLSQKDFSSLEELLRKTLFRRKYLIVLDDLWSIEGFEKLLNCFPDDNVRSRILITTRLSEVACIDDLEKPYEMKFLDDHKSWELFSNIVFGGGVCVSELKHIGKTIINSCKGLPLAIVVISGLLKASQDRNNWQKIATGVSSIINSDKEERCSKILSLSYSNLPIHLKPCFLYMSGYREDSEIYVPKLIKLWASDGFLKPKIKETSEKVALEYETSEKVALEYETSEKVALEYLNDLCNRNLITVTKIGSSGKTKECIMHDLIRDLCLKEANRKKFLFVLHKNTQHNLSDLQYARRIVCPEDFGQTLNLPSKSLARSLICKKKVGQHVIDNCRFLRVVDTIEKKLPFKNAQQLVSVRYLSISFSNPHVRSAFGTSTSKLWNLESLTISMDSYTALSLPAEVWELPHLKHLMFSQAVGLEEPVAAQIDCIRKDLQSVSGINGFNFTPKFTTKFPNLRKLKISYKWKQVSELQCLDNLISLQKLEVLDCSFRCRVEMKTALQHPCLFSPNFMFPPNLRKLTLGGSNIPWDNMKIVGSLLVNLEVCALLEGSFLGSNWNLHEVEFKSLKYLTIHADITKLEAGCSHFPVLKHLIIFSSSLNEVPWGIGEITTLQLICLRLVVKLSTVQSVKAIRDERIRRSGNNNLVIEVGVCADKVWDEMHGWGDEKFHLAKGQL